MKNSLLIFLCGLAIGSIHAQRTAKPNYSDSNNKGKAILFHFNFGMHIPGGDMAKRFGRDQSIGGGLEFITANNLIIGTEGHYFFSQKVKEDPLAGIRTPEGDIIGIDQGIASVVLRERGYYLGMNVGKLILFDKKRRSGLRLTASVGWIQHKIRVQDDQQSVPIVSGDYLKGYDRLTGGFTLGQFIGWQQLSVNRRINWFFGVDLQQGFTHALRDYDFAERRKLDGTRSDLRFGLRAGWIIPFYQKKPEDIYY